MPIYEYHCPDCGKRSSVLVLSQNVSPPTSCKHCRGSRLERVMSRFASPKSEEARMETLADPTKYGDLDENDPKSMARMMKRMGEEMGEDFGDELDAAMEDGEQAEEPTSSSMSDPE